MQTKTPWTHFRIMVAIASVLLWVATLYWLIQLIGAIHGAHDTADASGLTSVVGHFGELFVVFWLIPSGLLALIFTVIYRKETNTLRKRSAKSGSNHLSP